MAGLNSRTGVFFCNCEGKFTDNLDFKEIKKQLTLGTGEIVQEVPGLCKEEGQSQLSRSISAAALDGLVIAGCREDRLSKQCLNTACQHGIRPEKVAFVNLQDLCVNVHPGGPELNAKAARLTQQALVNQRLQEQAAQVEIPVNSNVLVIGNGPAAAAITRKLVKQQPVTVLGTESSVGIPGATYYASQRLVRVDGNTGNFKITLQADEKQSLFNAGGIVLALENPKVIDPSLKLPEAQGILSLSHFSPDLEQDWTNKTVSFVLGAGEQQSIVSTASVLERAVELREVYGARVEVFFQDMKVSGLGLEEKYQLARQLGIRFNRYQTSLEVHTNVLGITIRYSDLSLPNQESARVLVDYLIAGEIELPASEIRELSGVLGLSLGPHGFFQPDNVHLLAGKSNREGIYFVGSCHHPIHGIDLNLEAQAVAAELSRFVKGSITLPQLQAVVDSDKCSLCLTCYRTCPHRAVEIDYEQKAATVNPLACQMCGICTVECPAKAIHLPKFGDDQVYAQLAHTGKIVAFACENSGIPAAEMAGFLKRQYPVQVELLKVPCAGKIDSQYILQALQQGAQGVLMLACHHGSCKSLGGNLLAEGRLAGIREEIATVGLSPNRVALINLAANDGNRFAGAVNRWFNSLTNLE